MTKELSKAIMNRFLKPGSHFLKEFRFICFNESPLKMMKIYVNFILKALFVLKILMSLSLIFGFIEKMA